MPEDEVNGEDFEFIVKRIIEEAEVTTHKREQCEQCEKTIETESTAFRVGHSYFCSVRCLKGD